MRMALSSVAAACLAAGGANAAEDIMVVFDGSNSMWGQIDGVSKIEIARDTMESLMGDWVEGTNLGLIAYGHRRESDCGDIETILQPGPADRDDFLARISEITPRGKTPLTTAIEEAAKQLSYRDNPATVVLISDGIESCQRDPCALAEELERSGVDFTAHVVGFGLADEEDQAAIACIAERTGGRFIAAQDADELGEALGAVSAEVARRAPEPEPEPVATTPVEITAPSTVTAGADFDVSWSETLDPRDIVTIVPLTADEDEVADHLRTRDDTSGRLRAPAETGLYEVRYLRDDDRSVAGKHGVEVTPAQATVSVPESAMAGSRVPVSWTGNVSSRDIVTIVPAGADEGTVAGHLRVKDDETGKLTAPASPGLYEVRYVLDGGRKTVASGSIEITEAETDITAPETAATGSRFDVSWSRAISPRDIVTIVTAGAGEGTVEKHVRVKDNGSDTLRAPGVPGLYEVRYVLDEGRKTVAASPIEVTAVETEITVPETVLAGSRIPVSWSRSIDAGDIVTVVPAGANEGTVEAHVRVRDKDGDEVRAPGRPGLYEVRYVLDEGRKTLASSPVEIVEPEVEITATGTVRAGDMIEVGWSGDVPHPGDIVTLVPLGAPEGEVMDHKRVRDGRAAELRAPDQTGTYEVRYVLDEGRRTLARAPVEVVDETAAIDTGGSLEVPETATPGEEVQVSWTSSSDSGRQRVSLAQSDHADFTWIEAQATDNEPPLFFTMPDQPGLYEFRLLDLAGPKVLSRATIEVR